MTQEEILEYNKRCAEFLGYKGEPKFINTGEGKGYNGFIYRIPLDLRKVGTVYEGMLKTERTLKFHSDWNWIMEVVEAIEELKLGNVKIPITFSSTYQATKTEVQEYYDASVVFNISYSNCTVDIIGTMRLYEGFIVVDNLPTKKRSDSTSN